MPARISRAPAASCTGSTMIEIKTMTPLSPAARITAQRRKDSAELFMGERDWATVLPAPRIDDGFMTASLLKRVRDGPATRLDLRGLGRRPPRW